MSPHALRLPGRRMRCMLCVCMRARACSRPHACVSVRIVRVTPRMRPARAAAAAFNDRRSVRAFAFRAAAVGKAQGEGRLRSRDAPPCQECAADLSRAALRPAGRAYLRASACGCMHRIGATSCAASIPIARRERRWRTLSVALSLATARRK